MPHMVGDFVAFPALGVSRTSRRRWLILLLTLMGAFGSPAAWSHPGTGIVVDDSGQVFFVHGARNQILKLDAGVAAGPDGTRELS